MTVKGRYRPKSNFSISLETFVDAGDSTGYFATVTRKCDRQTKLCYYTTDALHQKTKWLQELRNTFGAGGFTCAFSDKELVEFHQSLEDAFPFGDSSKVKRGVVCAGKQPGRNTWVVNKNVQIDEYGMQVMESPFVWQPIGGPCIEITTGKSTVCINLESQIELPLQSSGPLNNLLQLLQIILKHNFIVGVLSVGAAVMALHYELLVHHYDACPIPMLVGDSETGKSTAARCALSVCGQHNVGHMMKTKSTSDSLCIERCATSTIPFALDDPKTAEGVGELLIDLCNGRLSGNMKVGLRKPRSIPLMCCNFTMGNVLRYSSRALILPFKLPTVGPSSEGESRAFSRIAECQRGASSAVGWAISLGKEFEDTGKEDITSRILPLIRTRLPHIDPRLCTGYATLLYFTEKLVEEADFGHILDELVEFLEEEVKQLVVGHGQAASSALGSSASRFTTSVIDAIQDAADWAQDLHTQGKSYEVRRTMRCDTTWGGKPVLAICLDDLAGHCFTVTSEALQKGVTNSDMGRHGVAKDFVPFGSHNPHISRKGNSHSRRCTVVALDTLPEDLSSQLRQATSPTVAVTAPTITAVTAPPTTAAITAAITTAPPSATITTAPPTAAITAALTTAPPSATITTAPPSATITTAPPSATNTTIPNIPAITPAATGSRKRKRLPSQPQGGNKRRATRSNTTLPSWTKDMDAQNPLGQ